MPSKLIPLVTPSSRKDWQIYSFSSTNQGDLDTNSWLFSDCQQRCQVHHGHPPTESKQIPLTASHASCPALRHPRWPGGWGGESLAKGPALHIDMLPVLLPESWLKLLYCCTLVNVFCLTLPHSSDPFLWWDLTVVLKTGLRMLHLPQISVFYCWSPSGFTISYLEYF